MRLILFWSGCHTGSLPQIYSSEEEKFRKLSTEKGEFTAILRPLQHSGRAFLLVPLWTDAVCVPKSKVDTSPYLVCGRVCRGGCFIIEINWSIVERDHLPIKQRWRVWVSGGGMYAQAWKQSTLISAVYFKHLALKPPHPVWLRLF